MRLSMSFSALSWSLCRIAPSQVTPRHLGRVRSVCAACACLKLCVLVTSRNASKQTMLNEVVRAHSALPSWSRSHAYSKALSRSFLYRSDAEKWPAAISILSRTSSPLGTRSRSTCAHLVGSQ